MCTEGDFHPEDLGSPPSQARLGQEPWLMGSWQSCRFQQEEIRGSNPNTDKIYWNQRCESKNCQYKMEIIPYNCFSIDKQVVVCLGIQLFIYLKGHNHRVKPKSFSGYDFYIAPSTGCFCQFREAHWPIVVQKRKEKEKKNVEWPIKTFIDKSKSKKTKIELPS